jgi:hypothetical protein
MIKPRVSERRIEVPPNVNQKIVSANENRSKLLVTVDNAFAAVLHAGTMEADVSMGLRVAGDILLNFTFSGQEAFARSEWWVHNPVGTTWQLTIFEVIGPSDIERSIDDARASIANSIQALAYTIARNISADHEQHSAGQFARQADVDYILASCRAGNAQSNKSSGRRGRTRMRGRHGTYDLDS